MLIQVPFNKKRGDVCIYISSSVPIPPVQLIDYLASDLSPHYDHHQRYHLHAGEEIALDCKYVETE